MNYNDKVIDLLKNKYDLNNIDISDSAFSLFSIGKEKDKNYIILENDSANLNEITKLQKFIDSLIDKKYKNASFIFVKCVQKDLDDDNLYSWEYDVVIVPYARVKEVKDILSSKDKKLELK